jgi:Fe-S cluster assembly iron-binding protein IscA
MALDEPNENDNVFEVDGYQYLINKEFLKKAKPIKVDFQMYGFKLDCSIDFGPGCGSCSTEGSCCSTE